MSDTKHEVEVKFTATDLTSKVLGNITKAAGNLGTRVDAITTKVAGFTRTFGGLGAIFGFGASIASAKSYLKTIDELSTVTGVGANKMAGMQHAMEQSGIAGTEVRAIMVSLARKQADIAGGSEEMAKMAKRYGVDLKKGPQAALISMAKSVEQGKMGTGEVVKLLEESGSKAMDLFRKGPIEVQRLMEEGGKKNAHVNETSIAQYKKMDIMMTRVKQAWTRITTTVLIKLAPALSKLMLYVEKNIDSWTDAAGRFGDFLVKHMDSAITSAKMFGKIMFANYAMMKLTGKGMLSNAGKLISMAAGKGGAGKILGGGAKENIMGMALKGGTKNKAMVAFASVMSKMPKIGPIFTKFFFGGVQLGKIAKILLRLSGLGIVVMSIVAGIKQILANVDGVRTRIGSLLGQIWENIKTIGATLGELFAPGSFLHKFFDKLGGAFRTTIEFIIWMLEKMTHAAAVAATMYTHTVGPAEAERIMAQDKSLKLAQDSVSAFSRATDIQANFNRIKERGLPVTIETVEGYKKMIAAFKKSDAPWAQSAKGIAAWTKDRGFEKFSKMPESPTDRPKVYQDFRGSRFDIMQSFAEGFDPDRIAVAFSNDLSSLGERRLQSGLAPAFAAR